MQPAEHNRHDTPSAIASQAASCGPSLMAIINATPDSFSDGGRHPDAVAAITAGREAAAAGARYLDIGGESTRPGSQAVTADIERQRVLPVITGLAAVTDATISIDTSKATVAAAAIEAGAGMINDVSAGRDPAMFGVAASAGVPYILMHMQGEPGSMQDDPRYGDVVDTVLHFFGQRLQAACRAGLREASIILDPGIGFGKTMDHNLTLLRALPRLHRETGLPLLVGLSRKRFLATVMGRDLAAPLRDGWSHLLHALIAPYCTILRVHDVVGAGDAIRAARCLSGGNGA